MKKILSHIIQGSNLKVYAYVVCLCKTPVFWCMWTKTARTQKKNKTLLPVFFGVMELRGRLTAPGFVFWFSSYCYRVNTRHQPSTAFSGDLPLCKSLEFRDTWQVWNKAWVTSVWSKAIEPGLRVWLRRAWGVQGATTVLQPAVHARQQTTGRGDAEEHARRGAE